MASPPPPAIATAPTPAIATAPPPPLPEPEISTLMLPERLVDSVPPLASAPPPSSSAPPPVSDPPAAIILPPQNLTPPRNPQASPAVTVSPSKPEPLPPEPAPTPSPASYTITIPSCSGWFSRERVHSTELRCLPEFFDGRSPSRNPGLYMYLRNSIVDRFRSNPSRKLTFTEARRALVADVGTTRRVFDFLEAWGLINYVPLPGRKEKPPAAMDEGVLAEMKERMKKACSECRAPCNMVCFITDKADIVLCARCFVRGNYRPGLSNHDFRRVDISQETDWTDKETIHLLEAVLQYGEDWKKVAGHVGSRTEKECVIRFIKLPFGEQFLEPPQEFDDAKIPQKKDQVNADNGEDQQLKRIRLSPLADASNPIMAQVAFLSAMVGSEVAQAASKAATAAIHDGDQDVWKEITSTNNETTKRNDSEIIGQNTSNLFMEAAVKAKSEVEMEQEYTEQSISDIIDVQFKEIQEHIVNFEELDFQIQKERVQLQYIKDLLFADQLNLHQQKSRLAKQRGDAAMSKQMHNFR